ncbi:MAG: YbaB/EbfC family nucleoid-associated protein [Pseudomonadota bacterium]
MKNIGQLMKQAQEMQSKMAELQERLESHEASGSSGGGMVQVTVNGKQMIKAVKIDPALVDPEEVEVLEDLIVAAANDAKTKMEAEVQKEMQGLTGGLSLPPGMKLPF